VRRQQERDLTVLLPLLSDLDDTQRQLFLMLLSLVGRFKGEGLDALHDEDVADGCGALAKTHETAARGVIYEHQAQSMPARRLVGELTVVLRELQKNGGLRDQDAALVLQRLGESVKRAHQVLGPGDRVLLDVASRMARQLETAREAPEKEPSRLVTPGAPGAGSLLIRP
jgi:hypothetical protein